MKKHIKNFLAITSLTVVLCAPVVAAQEVPDTPSPVVVTESAPSVTSSAQDVVDAVSDAPISEEIPASESSEQPIVQDTFNTQDSVTADILENTTNPDIVPVDDASASVSLDVASSTDVVVTPDATPSTPPVLDDVSIDDSTPIDVISADVTEVVSEVAAVGDPAELMSSVGETELLPKAEYVFALSGKIIPTKRKVHDASKTEVEEIVSDVLVPTVDNATGVVNIEGSCEDVYYVVLLFKNEGDYETDPRSFIVNRAYPCVDGHYSYSIDALPVSLENGKYYLLVGEQGVRGMWKPITGLTEIEINRNQ